MKIFSGNGYKTRFHTAFQFAELSNTITHETIKRTAEFARKQSRRFFSSIRTAGTRPPVNKSRNG
jgi:hypothetical protein